MTLKLFSPEEMEELRSNKYTRIVEKDHISFTPEFREDFWNLYKGDISPATIMESMGYICYNEIGVMNMGIRGRPLRRSRKAI